MDLNVAGGSDDVEGEVDKNVEGEHCVSMLVSSEQEKSTEAEVGNSQSPTIHLSAIFTDLRWICLQMDESEESYGTIM